MEQSVELERGSVVKSTAGRDGGRFYAVMRVEGRDVYIADGKLRRVEAPKSKNRAHLALTLVRLDEETLAANGRLCRALQERFAENRA